MTRVLFVGQQPETVDFTDPIAPPRPVAGTGTIGAAFDRNATSLHTLQTLIA